MWRKVWRLLTIVVLIIGVGMAVAVAAQDKSYSAQRFDVDVVVQEDGSLRVTETVVFDFVGGPFTFVFRELETDLTDGITNISAAVDGRSYPPGEEAGQVDIDGSDPIRVQWNLEPTSNSTRTFTLQYTVLGVVRQTENGDLLRYQPLPDAFEYTIASSTMTFRTPGTAVPLSAPIVTTNNADVDASGSGFTLRAGNIDPDETIVVEQLFQAGSLISAPPQWQQQRDQQNARAPLWVGIAVIISVVGLLGVIFFYNRSKPQVKKLDSPIYDPPTDLPPAVGGILQGNGADPSWQHALATLFDLADRGVLVIEEMSDKKWYRQHDFEIQLMERPSGLRPHEAGLIDALFHTKRGWQDSIKLSELSSLLGSRQWKRYTEPLKQELRDYGFIDDQRKRTRSWFMGIGALLMVLSIAVLIILIQFAGPWAMVVFGSLLFISIAAIIAGSALPPLTDDAVVLAAEWQRFGGYLKQVTKGKAAVSQPDMFTQFLPYAAGIGILDGWANYFKKAGWTELPAYFHVLPTTTAGDGMAAFAAFAATSSSSGGAAAGAAGAGAAGGGASGAG